jgi:ribosomal protein S3
MAGFRKIYILTNKLGVENPQIDVIDVSKIEAPEMFPKVVAYRMIMRVNNPRSLCKSSK